MPRIILDTNVVSALFFDKEDRSVKDWVSSQDPEILYLTSINLAEILFGIRKLVPGKKRNSFEEWYNDSIYPNFVGRILPFDRIAADRWATLHAADCAAGKQRPLADSYIAAIAQVHDCSIATRNRRDFERLGLHLIDPFLPHGD